jgi:uncharacterized protein (DUF1330 family)
MRVTEATNPTETQLALLAAYPDDAPFVMCNLLKFAGSEGARRYWEEYAPQVTPLAESAGGTTIARGAVRHLIIGAAPHDWDAVWLVRWPSKAHFLAMMNHPDFPATQEIRVGALERMALLLMTELPPTP